MERANESAMDVRFYIDASTGLPHIHGHGISEDEVLDVFRKPIEYRAGAANSRVVIGRTRAGRILRVIIVVDADGRGTFVITAYTVAGKQLTALRRRLKRRGKQ